MNRRDLELLSAYLDGELKSSDSIKLETRLQSDPELASVLSNLRAARTLFRKLPSRRAPRNFTLTRKMVGQNPPLPRAYSIFQFAASFATILFFFSFAVNALAPQFAQPYNFGRGGGAESLSVEEAPAMAEQPAQPAEPAVEMPAAPAPADSASQEPSVSLAPQATQSPSNGDTTHMVEEPPAQKIDEGGIPVPVQEEPIRLISSAWQVGLVVVALVSAMLMGLMKRASARRWK